MRVQRDGHRPHRPPHALHIPSLTLGHITHTVADTANTIQKRIATPGPLTPATRP
ncbi:hypothetical protein ACFYWX_33270 [Streptomyces sp. NPDC002888]|uniref:hypothetical protein n=1 Tax=Streptomyces sp. NPDC002888 TaxID=3364668 RepID=UPI00367972C6